MDGRDKDLISNTCNFKQPISSFEISIQTVDFYVVDFCGGGLTEVMK